MKLIYILNMGLYTIKLGMKNNKVHAWSQDMRFLFSDIFFLFKQSIHVHSQTFPSPVCHKALIL